MPEWIDPKTFNNGQQFDERTPVTYELFNMLIVNLIYFKEAEVI